METHQQVRIPQKCTRIEILPSFDLSRLCCLGVWARFVLEPEGWELRGASTARSRLSGTFDFLEYQFQEVVENKVRIKYRGGWSVLWKYGMSAEKIVFSL